MQFCEQDCAIYTMLKKKGVCNNTLALIRKFAADLGNRHITEGITFFEKFDCYDISSYQFFESNGYAQKCTGLLSTQSKGKEITEC